MTERVNNPDPEPEPGQLSLRISVVMATWNGEDFLGEQMESLLRQTRPADEVLIFDDGSSDQTCHLAERFIDENNLSANWKLIRNPQNKGCRDNFLEGALQASGDIIFFSDQDDIWDEKKLEIMTAGFEQYPDMLAAYCRENTIDEHDRIVNSPIARVQDIKPGKDLYQKISCENSVKYGRSSGHRLAFRRTLLPELADFVKRNNLTYDLTVGLLASVRSGYYLVNQILVSRRVHTGNLSDPHLSVSSRTSDLDYQIHSRKVKLDHLIPLYNEYGKYLSSKEQKELEKAIHTWRSSIEKMQKHDINSIFSLFWSIFDSNPMVNRWMLVNNFLTCMKAG